MVGKYQAYPEYRESGNRWLEKVPATWLNTRMDDVALTIKEQVAPRDIESIQVMHYSIPTIQEIGTGREEDGATVDSNKFRVQEGDVLFSKLNPRKQTITTVRSHDQVVVASTEFIVLRSHSDNQQFLQYLLYSQELKSFVCSQVESATKSHQRINPSVVSKLKFALPSKEERFVIVNFLDHETAKIDTLIDKQQQLIQLLKEKRQAVISHAVTKGLNPNAPMRDSGVEWLGEVPEHWVVTQLKFYTLDMQTGPFGSQLHAEDYVTNEIPLINPAHMISGELIPDPNVTVDEATQERLSRHKLSAGDIIFARRGELGRCAVVQKQHEGWLCGTGSLKAKLNKRLTPEYAYLLITSEGVISELSLESKGSTMDNLNTETLGRVRIPVPPVSEQSEILQYVESVSGKYASLVTKAETAINLMHERRTALISAAVTGKIDVRHPVCHPAGDLQSSKSTVHGDL